MMANDKRLQKPQDAPADVSSEHPKVSDTAPWPDYLRSVETYEPKKYE
jgi:hypothetical protein